MSTISSVKGTRDFFPEEMAFRQWLYATLRDISQSFGYQEFDGPFLERIELYAAKSGEELVEQQAYVFADRGGDRVALRPELTPTLARMVAQRVRALPLPIRWWSFGPFWRYEQPQKGRSREFFQWNIDLLGIDSPQADAEIVAIGAQFLSSVGLEPEQVQIRVNNRRLMETELAKLDIASELRDEVFRLIDRKEKMEPDEWRAYASDIGLSDPQLEGLRELLDNADAWQESEELTEFLSTIEDLGVQDYVTFDPAIIRGLDYYTGTVFEARDTAGEQRAILGGGRYDNLVAEVGGDPVPGVGFAMGDVVLELVLQQEGMYPDLRPNPADVLMTQFDEDTARASVRAASLLRREGLRVEWYPEPGGLGKQFRYADRYGIPVVAILGPEELETGDLAIKVMATGEQETVPLEEAPDRIKVVLDDASIRPNS
ncbi:MAG: histidine--tRNA ligase [Anaerolineales bacterium]|nr:histidine--tRNA ligase [Anaerolineales bacterium]